MRSPPTMPNASRVLVFARAPIPGATKTRLIPALGADGAAALHARLVEHALETVRRSGLRLELHGSPADDAFLRLCAERYGAPLVEQSGNDLGLRMRTAFECALQGGGPCIIVGADCPALTPRHLRRAARALERGHDAVFVPTEDGGYALVGLSRVHGDLFAGVDWGTSRVMAQTRLRLRTLAWCWLELDQLWDVDRPEDYARLVASGLLDRNPAHRVRSTTGPPPDPAARHNF